MTADESEYPPPAAWLSTTAGRWELARGPNPDVCGRLGTPLLYVFRREGDSRVPVIEGSLDVGQFVACVLDQIRESTATALLEAATGASAPEGEDFGEQAEHWIAQVREAIANQRFIPRTEMIVVR